MATEVASAMEITTSSTTTTTASTESATQDAVAVTIAASAAIGAPMALESSDGWRFVLDSNATTRSSLLTEMLKNPMPEGGGKERVFAFREISSAVLSEVVIYLFYALRWNNSTVEIPEFIIDPLILLELLMAANFLDC